MSELTNYQRKLQRKTNITGYLFILPNFLGFLAFIAFPLIYAFILSFTKWDGITPMQFVGFKNYIKLFQDKSFIISLTNTFYYMIFSVPLMVGSGLILAVALTGKIRFKKFFNTVFFLPNISSLVALSIVWRAIYHPTMGPINLALKNWGVENPPLWVSSPTWAMPSLIIMSVWLNTGYYMVIYIAALQGIPKSYYEAAELDGANWWQIFSRITIPSVSRTTFFAVVIAIINSFKIFAQVVLMTDGGPGRSTNVLGFFIYKASFSTFRFGYAAAASYVLFAILLGLTIIQYRGQQEMQ